MCCYACKGVGTNGMTIARSYDTGQLLANHLGGHHLEKAHGIKVAPIIGRAIGIGQYWVSVTLLVIVFFLCPLPIMSPRACDVCE